jgi:hypothetical protein
MVARVAVLLALAAGASTLACNRGGGNSGSSSIRPAATSTKSSTGTATATTTTSSSGAKIEPPAPAATPSPAAAGDAPDAITADTLIRTQLYIKDTPGAETCVTAAFKLTAKGQPAADTTVKFSIAPKETATDPGTLTPEEAKTDASGVAETTYCAGTSEMVLSVVAKVGALQANSQDVTVSKKPTYSFSFVKSDASITIAKAEGAAAADGKEDAVKDGVITLNLLDSGPNDCTKLYFALKQGDQPYVGAEVAFKTQQDYPKGAKLAEKDKAATTEESTTTGKKTATYTATSNAQGELVVPVCSGVDLGTLLVTGYWKGDDLKEYTAQAPVIQINAGLTYFSNMTLTYDTENAKILRGAFNNNVKHVQPFWVKLGARGDGDPVLDYPVAVASEFGEVVLENGGLPTAAEGTVKFTVEAAHLDNYRPYPVHEFSQPLGQTRCDPVKLSMVGTNDTANVPFSDLRMNWRSTIVYMVRGQEAFFDANRNGVYDEGGDGFWDKNQNGVYDDGDVLTYDAGGDDAFNIKSEWFIDLPSPFIDVNENGSFDAKDPTDPTSEDVDILIGDQFVPPNGKRDADTLIWKHDYLPIYVGTSPVALMRGEIKKAPNFGVLTDTIGKTWFDERDADGLRNGSATRLYTGTARSDFYLTNYDWNGDTAVDNDDLPYAYEAGGEGQYYLFAHDICGNPPPGGSKVAINVEAVTEVVGDRAVTGHIYMQAGDNALDPKRRFFSSSPGTNEAVVNFNVAEHPSSGHGYPFEFSIRIAPCTDICSGPLAVFGTYCSGKNVNVTVTVDNDGITRVVNVPQTRTCRCKNDPATSTEMSFDYSTGTCETPP